MRYINTTDENITFTDVDGKVVIVPKNQIYTHFKNGTVTFLLLKRYDNEGNCIFTTLPEDVQINGVTYTYEQLLSGNGLDSLYSPTGIILRLVEELPESGEDSTIYLVPNDAGSYTEYIWLKEESKWEELGDITQIDLSNYYTKAESEALFATQTVVNQEIAARISKDSEIEQALLAKADKTQLADYVEKSVYNDKQTVIVESLYELKNEKADKTEIPDISNLATKAEVALKQDILTAGNNITIQNNVISATGGTQIQSDWNQTDTTAVDYIKNKPSFDEKEEVISRALNELHDAVSNVYTKAEIDNKIGEIETILQSI